VRLLLDAHVSGRRIGSALADAGHDVRALDQEPALEGIGDEHVLSLAAEEQRVLVTFDVADFPAIAGEWAQAGRGHAGLLLVHGFTHRQFGAVARAVLAELERRPGAEDWRNLSLIASRASA
jgi:predicted nuclease of predicted toxin-antitoxin system